MGPPIVLVLLDQWRADALGAAGNRFVRTPHLDRLAESSVRFEGCVTNAPLCRPARVTLMTGQPVHLHRVSTNHRVPDGGGVPSHVRRLRDAGYATAVVGKTHLHPGRGHPADHVDRLRAWGFEQAVELPDAQMHWLRSAHSDWLTASTPAGEVDRHVRWREYVAGYDWETPPPDVAPWRLGVEEHLDSFCAREAARWIRGYPGDRPPYLQVCFPGPHPPFDAPSALGAGLDPGDPTLPPAILGPSRGPVSPIRAWYARAQRAAPSGWTEARIRALRCRYYAKVALVDAGIGRVVEALRAAGLYDEAWIVVTADHGELLGDHGLMGKVVAFEGAIRVPLLVRPPGGVAGWVDRGTVDLLDVSATISAIGGVEPGPWGTPLVGRVLGGPSGASAHADRAVLFENLGYVGLRDGPWTLGWQLDLGRPVELYDRRVDPEQRWNGVEEPEWRPALERLVEGLRQRRGLRVDRFGFT